MKDVKQLKYTIKKHIPRCFYPLLIEYYYYKRMGQKCNLKTPQSFSEKIQWSKLYRQNDIIMELSDKIRVRDWVKKKIGEEYLIPVIGDIYTDPANIDFDSLPQSFVIKTNHGCGTNIIVNDKEEIDKERIVEQLKVWLNHNFAYDNLELQYEKIRPQIFFEKNLLMDGAEDLPDYKFFCFNGKVFCSYTMVDYTFDHSKGKLGFFDRNYKIMPYHRKDYFPICEQLEKPQNYDKMVEIAETLSKDFSHVRVDLYNIDGKIYFGEMTFSTCGGYCKYEPKNFDEILGKQWDINLGI